MSDYLASRPASAELEAVARAIAIAEETGCSLHIVHASTAAAVLLVAEARAGGVDVTCETCPHYLLLTDEDAERIGALAKCSPPLRPRAEVEALWAELLAGTIPFVASDHSPSPPDLKEGDDAFAMWGGISGCQTLRSSLLAVAEQPRPDARGRCVADERSRGRALRSRRQGPARAGLRRRPRDRRPRPRERARGRRPALPPPAQRVRRLPAAGPRRPDAPAGPGRDPSGRGRARPAPRAARHDALTGGADNSRKPMVVAPGVPARKNRPRRSRWGAPGVRPAPK